jgi:mono/diheme cytochrome c family protein
VKLRTSWLFLLLMVPLGVGVGTALADRDEHESKEHKGFFKRWFKSDSMQVNGEGSERYQEECGSCHFPFQPGFLPEASWRLIMAGLDDHFGEDAELSDVARRVVILNYLTMHSADANEGGVSQKVLWSLRSAPVPMRITETRFFRHEHDEIPERVLENNGEKISFSNCDTCHTGASQGYFNEHEIKIPGFGRWDD